MSADFVIVRAGRGAELQWNKTIRVIHHVSTFLGFTRDKIISSPPSSPHSCSRSEQEGSSQICVAAQKEDMPLENVVRSYDDMIDRHGNKIYLG